MIFPELPRRIFGPEQITDSAAKTNVGPCTAKAPLHCEEQTTGIDIELWFEQHGLPSLRTDPAAMVGPARGTQINWWARDAVEFYALCVAMILWIVYWYGVHHGAW